MGSCWLMIREFRIVFLISCFGICSLSLLLSFCHVKSPRCFIAFHSFTSVLFCVSCCCFDKPRTSFVCSVDYVKLELFKMVDVLSFHYLHKKSWSFLPSTFFRICDSQRCDVGLSPSIMMLHNKCFGFILFHSTSRSFGMFSWR